MVFTYIFPLSFLFFGKCFRNALTAWMQRVGFEGLPDHKRAKIQHENAQKLFTLD